MLYRIGNRKLRVMMAVGLPCLCFLSGSAVAEIEDATESIYYAATAPENVWETRRDAARLDRELDDFLLEVDNEAKRLDWRFTPLAESFNDIFLDREITQPFKELSLSLDNPGAAFSLAIKAVDAGGSEWTVPRRPVPAGSEGVQVDYTHEDWMQASWAPDPDGELDFPLQSLAIIAFDLEQGEAYHIRLEQITIKYPKAPELHLETFTLPTKLQAGEEVQFDMAFTLDKPCLVNTASLILHRNDQNRTEIPLPFDASTLDPNTTHNFDDLSIQIPRFIYGGASSLALQVGEARVVYEGSAVGNELMPVEVLGRDIGETKAEVRSYRGKPTLFINDEPHNGMAYTAYNPELSVFEDFTEAGVDLYSISATPTESGYGLSKTVWKAPDVYDFSQLDERVRLILEAHPDAYIFPRLYLHAPSWWSEQHPDDVVLMDPGNGDPVVFQHVGPKPAPSWASETWRQDTIEGLRRLIGHVEASPYADRIIGYHLASGTTEEWMMWGANEGEWVDYSPVNRQRFQTWLREKYQDISALQAAWDDPELRFETAQIPTRQEREASHFGILRNPDIEQPVIDYYTYHSHLVADTIKVFAQATKEIAGADKTVGIFYGYLLQLSGEQRQQNAGHLALGEVLASPHIDFLCSPTSYAFREPGGEGTSHFMSLLNSVQQHGKLWFNENDIRTSLAPGEVGDWGKSPDVAGDIVQQNKELAHTLVNGAAQWWFDVGGNRYDDPVLMQRLGELVDIADVVRDRERRPQNEVALVVDEKSLCYLIVGHRMGNDLLTGQLPALHRMGAPVGHYLTSDLEALLDQRMLILASSFAPDAAQRAALEDLKGGGRTLVFLWNSGLYGPEGISAASASAFTGIQMRLSEEARNMRVYPAPDTPEALAGLEYGAGNPVAPMLLPDEPEAQVLGQFEDGTPAVVMREYDDWTAVYAAVPLLPSTLWRYLGESAGVHRYLNTPDVVWASDDLIGVSVAEAGARTLHLPRPAAVEELYRGESFDGADATIEIDFEARETRLFLLDSP